MYDRVLCEGYDSGNRQHVYSLSTSSFLTWCNKMYPFRELAEAVNVTFSIMATAGSTALLLPIVLYYWTHGDYNNQHYYIHGNSITLIRCIMDY